MSIDQAQTPLFSEEQQEIFHARCWSVLVPYPVDKAYDYVVPEGMDLQPGDYVTVPLSGREVPGVVWDEAEGIVSSKKLKAVVAKHHLPPMPEVQRKFLDWLAHYTMSAKGAVLKMCLSVPAALEPAKAVKGYALSDYVLEAISAGESPPPSRRGEVGRGVAENAKKLRKNQTEAEKKLWEILSRERMGCKFRRQHPIPPYVADFICLEKKLIIEADGGQHGDMQKDYDEKRTQFLNAQGYRVIRFWNEEILTCPDGVWQKINEALAEPPPTLILPPPGGGRKGVFQNLTPLHRHIVEMLSDKAPRRLTEITEEIGCTPGVIKKLVEKDILQTVELYSSAPCRHPDPAREGPDLSGDQEGAAEHLCGFVQKGGFQAALLDGVTGAGKTEVYFEAVAEALKQGQQVLILLPEIALSNAFLDRFKSRFGCAPALWHSNLTPAQRRTTWRGVAENETRVVVGARSALFLPYADLGLIVVDEEHDPAFKQEDGVIYHARDMAVVRASLGKIPVVLVSATPSLESIHNAWSGRYDHLHLPARYGGAHLPEIELIDLRADKPERGSFISPTLKKAVAETIQGGGQALLFLNRRGYAPLTLCRTCGHRMECPRCTSWLVEHKQSSKLHCHHCGYGMALPKTCPECGDTDSFAACGPGVERILEEVKSLYPDAKTLLLASDTAESGDKLRAMLRDIKEKKIDIIVGTQIIAKGHHFPDLTCVGVIDADLGLSGGELRAAERTYQLLHQVAGRAGRAEKKGKVYLQTFMPEHRIMRALAAGARDAFFEAEASEREAAHMPPYARLAGIIVSGRDERQALEVAKALGRTAPQQGKSLLTLGPAPAPLARLRGRYRFRLLVRADKNIDIQKTIAAWIGAHKIPSTVRVQVDIDPQSFL